MGPMYYIGLDVHKQKISYCVKDVGGTLLAVDRGQTHFLVIDQETRTAA